MVNLRNFELEVDGRLRSFEFREDDSVTKLMMNVSGDLFDKTELSNMLKDFEEAEKVGFVE